MDNNELLAQYQAEMVNIARELGLEPNVSVSDPCYYGDIIGEAVDELKNGYAQLVRVARNMLSWCDHVMTHYSGEGGTPEDVSAFRDQLKALGVDM